MPTKHSMKIRYTLLKSGRPFLVPESSWCLFFCGSARFLLRLLGAIPRLFALSSLLAAAAVVDDFAACFLLPCCCCCCCCCWSLCLRERETRTDGRTDGLEDLGFFANNKKARSGCAFLKLFSMANFLLHLPRGHQQ